MDIEKAMAIESEYLADPSHEVGSLSGLLKNAGYETLDAYFSDKVKWQARQGCTILEMTSDESDPIAYKAMAEGQYMLIIDRIPRLSAWVGSDDPIDESKAISLGVDLHPFPYKGGTIIGGPEDLILVFIYKDNVPEHYFRDRLVAWLGSKCGAYLRDNDVMLDGKKVAGMAYYKANGMTMFLTQLGLSDHMDIIRELCVPNPDKLPGVLPLSQTEIINEVKTWVQ